MNQNSNSNHFNFSLFTLPERKKGNQNPKQEMKTKRRIKKETPQPFKGIDIRNFIPNFETKKKQLESLDDVIFEFKNLLNEKTEEEKEEDKPIQEIDDSMFFLRPFEDYYALNFGITLNPQIRIFSILKKGMIVGAKIIEIARDYFIAILNCFFGRKSDEIILCDLEELGIKTVCKAWEINDILFEQYQKFGQFNHTFEKHSKKYLQEFLINDFIKAIVIEVSVEEKKVLLSLRNRNLLVSFQKNHYLGRISSRHVKLLKNSSNDFLNQNFLVHLNNEPGFKNPSLKSCDSSFIPKIKNLLFIENFEAGRYENLRLQQNRIWATETVSQGVVLAKKGDIQSALNMYQKALDVDPENSDALVAQGAAFANQNKMQIAINSFKKALEIDPEHQNAKRYLEITRKRLALQLNSLIPQNYFEKNHKKIKKEKSKKKSKKRRTNKEKKKKKKKKKKSHKKNKSKKKLEEQK
ncbi:tetratricopeptide repeat protein [Anaeramoeba ignava]|uniref:Tetratricopeptide repeat protein n=1 Tax=Anaeramoeba ignava TaxID=1746090 RepID=A0A9Q0LJH1_ANAIG|nr:tetratricopeptide repeat protein [Anaeramoeba ignava]